MQGPVIHKAHLFGCKLLKTFHWYSGEKREFSSASHNWAAEWINTNVTAKYPIRAHLYSIILQGLSLFGCNLEQSSSDTAYKKVHLYNTLNLKICIQEPLSQSLELFLAVTSLRKSLLRHGMFLNGVLVGENTRCSRMQRLLHSPGMTGNFYVRKTVTKITSCANQQGQDLFLQKSQGTFNASCLEECMCTKSWRCYLSALVQY